MMELRFETGLNEIALRELVNIGLEMDQKVQEELSKTNLPKSFIEAEREANTCLGMYNFYLKLIKNEFKISLEDLEQYFNIIKYTLWERVEDLKAIGAYEMMYDNYRVLYSMVFDPYYINKYYKKGGGR